MNINEKDSKRNKIIVVSGGFDPIHIGHIRMFKHAKLYGDKLIVILNNDNWLRAKKGYAFMPEQDRKEIILSFACVDEVIITSHPPFLNGRTDVVNELIQIKNKYSKDHIYFANGGDRHKENTPELDFCKEANIQPIFNIGGDKIRSSSELVERGITWNKEITENKKLNKRKYLLNWLIAKLQNLQH